MFRLVLGDEPIAVPRAALASLPEAGETDLRVLISLCARENGEERPVDPAELAAQLDLTPDEVEGALAFWRGAGILKTRRARSRGRSGGEARAAELSPAPDGKTLPLLPSESANEPPAQSSPDSSDSPDASAAPNEGAGETSPAREESAPLSGSPLKESSEAPPAPAPLPEDGAAARGSCAEEDGGEGEDSSPGEGEGADNVVILRADSEAHYTGEELLRLLDEREDLRELLDECQFVSERMFSIAESCKVITLADVYHLSSDYILTVFQYCRSKGRCTVPFVYKTAVSLACRGIDNMSALEEYLREEEEFGAVERLYRKLRGEHDRMLTAREKNYIRAWSREGFGEPLLTMAYEASIDNTGRVSMPYMNKILARWKQAGITTAEQALEDAAAWRVEKNAEAAREKYAGGETAPGGDTGAPGGKGKGGQKPTFHSFDADDFFRRALARSDEQGSEALAKESSPDKSAPDTPAPARAARKKSGAGRKKDPPADTEGERGERDDPPDNKRSADTEGEN